MYLYIYIYHIKIYNMSFIISIKIVSKLTKKECEISNLSFLI